MLGVNAHRLHAAPVKTVKEENTATNATLETPKPTREQKQGTLSRRLLNGRPFVREILDEIADN